MALVGLTIVRMDVYRRRNQMNHKTTIDQKLEAIRKAADVYIPSYQKDYHIGMLEAEIIKQHHEMQSLKNEIKDLQIKLINA